MSMQGISMKIVFITSLRSMSTLFIFISFSFYFICLIFFALLIHFLQFVSFFYFFHCSLTSEFTSSSLFKYLDKDWKIIKMVYGKLQNES